MSTGFLSGVMSEVGLRRKKPSAVRNRREVELYGGGEDEACREES